MTPDQLKSFVAEGRAELEASAKYSGWRMYDRLRKALDELERLGRENAELKAGLAGADMANRKNQAELAHFQHKALRLERELRHAKRIILAPAPALPRRAVQVFQVCPRCHGDKIYQPTGVEEIYRCPSCNGSGIAPVPPAPPPPAKVRRFRNVNGEILIYDPSLPLSRHGLHPNTKLDEALDGVKRGDLVELDPAGNPIPTPEVEQQAKGE